MNHEQKLIEFLIDNCVILRYRRNLRDHKLGMVRKNVKIPFNRLLKPFKPKDYIHSFDWSLTKEGFGFWHNIDKKWETRLKKMQ